MSNSFFSGVKFAAPIVLGYIPIGFAYGVLATSIGLTCLETVLMSVLVYAGSSQFVAISLLSSGAAAGTIIATTFLVNLRHLLMSASLVPHLRRFNLPFLAAVSYQITDETFALAASRYSHTPPTPAFHAGLSLTSHLSWISGSFLGAAAGSLIAEPTRWGLDFALPAMFIALLVLQTKKRPAIIAAAAAAAVSLFMYIYLPGNINIISGAVLGATLGVFWEQWSKN